MSEEVIVTSREEFPLGQTSNARYFDKFEHLGPFSDGDTSTDTRRRIGALLRIPLLLGYASDNLEDFAVAANKYLRAEIPRESPSFYLLIGPSVGRKEYSIGVLLNADSRHESEIGLLFPENYNTAEDQALLVSHNMPEDFYTNFMVDIEFLLEQALDGIQK